MKQVISRGLGHISPHTTTGILKTPEKNQDSYRPPKTLNFAPVVNLFNPGTKFSEQLPLPSPTNSSSSEGNCSSSMVRMNSFQPSVDFRQELQTVCAY